MTGPSGPVRRALLLGSVTGLSGVAIGAPGVVLHDVGVGFGVSDDATAWIIAAFVLGTGVAMTLGGRALDLYGSRRVVAVGAVGVLAGTALVALASGFALAVVGRFVQGAGNGWLTIAAFNAVSYTPAAQRHRAGGVLTAMSFSCIAISPLFGALVAAAAGWRAALCTSVLTLLPVPALLRGLPPERRTAGRLDLPGAALAAVAGVAGAAVLQAPATATPAVLAAVLALVAIVAGAVLVRHLRAHPEGFLPLAVLRNRRLVEYSVVASTVQAAYTGLIFAAPLLLAREAGWSALQTGAALAPGAAVAALAATTAGTVGTRHAVPVVFALLAAISATGILVAGLGARAPLLIIAGTLVTIAPYAAVQAVMIGGVSSLVAPRDIGAATGTFTFIFITGGMVGAAAAGGLTSVLGLQAAVLLLVALPVGGAALAARLATAPEPVVLPAPSQG